MAFPAPRFLLLFTCDDARRLFSWCAIWKVLMRAAKDCISLLLLSSVAIFALFCSYNGRQWRCGGGVVDLKLAMEL
jgi:hypothetical protein